MKRPQRNIIDIAKIYDKLSIGYDSFYRQKIHFVEEEIISSFLPDIEINSKILDIGCGTGNMINVGQYGLNQYTGVDISEEMLIKAQNKYEGYEFLHLDGSEVIKHGEYDLILHVFGQLNYMGVERWMDSILANINQDGKFFTIMYAPEYQPDYINFNLVHPELEIIDIICDEVDIEYECYGLSFPMIGEENMSFSQLLHHQLTMTSSGNLDGCKYWMLIGKTKQKNKPNLRLVK